MKGRQQIVFFSCSEFIFTFLDKCDITPFNEVESFDRGDPFLNLRLEALKKSYISFPNHTSRSLKSSNTQIVVNCKTIFATTSTNTV